MVDSTTKSSLADSIRPIANALGLGSRKADSTPTLPTAEVRFSNGTAQEEQEASNHENGQPVEGSGANVASKEGSTTAADGEASAAIEPEKKPSLAVRFYRNVDETLRSSLFNWLLVFVPVGIVVKCTGLSPIIVFAMNAVAIIPLAGLLSHATEAVAVSVGDTVGALLNVTFGNAVELIIFIIALVNNEIRIVQASLVGSILANLLLILGMCFLFGGLKYREQIYNSTVTQMSACLLSLSVTSLLLPTAFHAAFSAENTPQADTAVVQLSRGSSVILLLVYVLYLCFQLKSHAYMYESTPQHVIDEESHPGVLADILNSSSSSSSDSDTENSDGSSNSHTTAKRLRRAFRRGRRKSSASSKDTPSIPSTIRTPSNGGLSIAPSPLEKNERHQLGAIASGDEADDDETPAHLGGFGSRVYRRDFGSPNGDLDVADTKPEKKKSKKKGKKTKNRMAVSPEPIDPQPEDNAPIPASPRVAFVQHSQSQNEESPRRPFNLRTLSVRPAMPKMLSTTVFSAANPTGAAVPPPVPFVPRAPYGLRRTSSLPDRLNRSQSVPREQQSRPGAALPTGAEETDGAEEAKKIKHMSRTAAVVLLLISTGLVALCAEFLVGSINYMVSNTQVSEVFIGLILLPIVGNAAEHVTAVTVASKNKMDLAIGVAVGSSIQVSLLCHFSPAF